MHTFNFTQIFYRYVFVDSFVLSFNSQAVGMETRWRGRWREGEEEEEEGRGSFEMNVLAPRN